MFKSLLTTVVASVALLLLVTGDNVADAQPHAPASPSMVHVYYRISVSSPWQYYRGFTNQADVNIAVGYLRSVGYETFTRGTIPHVRMVHVFYRTSMHDPWQYHGSFPQATAQQAAAQLRAGGFEVYMN